MLFEKRVNLHIQNNDGYTALHQAVEKKNIHVVEKLLQQKAKQNTVLENGKTPLHTAIERKDIEKINAIIEKLEKEGRRPDEDVPVTREDPQLSNLKKQLKDKKEEYFKYIIELKKEKKKVKFG